MADAIDEGTEQPMTEEQFVKLMNENFEEWFELFLSYHDVEMRYVEEWREFGETEQAFGFYINEVTQIGGQHDGQSIEVIFDVCKDEVDDDGPCTRVHKYFRVTGCYSSYEGNEWDTGVEEVVPRDVVVTKWFAADGSDDKGTMK